MYPDSLFWWIGGTAILLGILGLIGMLAWWVDSRYQRHIEKRHGAPGDDEEGRSALWLVLDVLSAIFVATGLLVAIYSDSALLRAVAGIAMIVLVAVATWSALARTEEK